MAGKERPCCSADDSIVHTTTSIGETHFVSGNCGLACWVALRHKRISAMMGASRAGKARQANG